MAKKILNKHNQVDVPTLILQNKNFENLGTIVDASDLTYKENMNSANELSFTIYKNIDDKKNIIWDKITNGKVIYLPEFKERFEVTVTTTSENSVSKSVTATSLCECELSQINIYNLEVNTEDDIAREDYDADKPTIFYDEDDHSRSLLHRILSEKASHYSIKHVDETLKNIQRMDLSFSDIDIYGLLTGDISEEFGCLFVFDSMDRSISAYDLYNTCHDCGYRGDFSEKCPECNSTSFSGQYGDDTTVFITNENLATQITLEPDWDSYKNCFYVEGGDDLINATIRMINPNGSNYIYYISEDTKNDMPSELVAKIESYDEEYNRTMTSREFGLDKNIIQNYNVVVDYVNQKFANDDNVNYSKIYTPVIGYSSITSMLYETIDFYQFVNTSMMPTISTDHMTISESLQNIINGFAKGFTLTDGTTVFANEIAVLNSTSIVQSKVENEILKLAKMFYGSAYYDLDVVTSSYSQATETTKGKWTGKFVITSLTEKNETTNEFISEESGQVTIFIGNDYELYIQQSIAKQMADRDSLDEKNITSISMNDSTFKEQIGYYSYDELNSLYESFKSCLDVLLTKQDEDGVNDGEETRTLHEDIRNRYSGFYTNRCKIIDQQMQRIGEYLDYIKAVYYYDSETYETSGILNDIIEVVNKELNFESYVGQDLWHTFCSYRREDKYTNSNVISDGLTNNQLVEYSTDLYEKANKELYKAGTLQYSISTTMNNLLVLPEFRPFVENFNVGNWIRVGMDDKIYKLRLLSYQVSFDEIQTINVEFSTVTKISDGISDIKSILDSAQSMASSYDGMKALTENNTQKSKYVSTWISDGFKLTNQKIVSGANNQTIIIDEHGITAVKYNDDGIIDDCQLKLFNNGLYITDDAWGTIRTGVGKFIYLDPKNNFKETVGYGVIADTIVSNIVCTKELGIYNESGSVEITGDGIMISKGTIQWRNVDGLSEDLQTALNDATQGIADAAKALTDAEAYAKAYADGLSSNYDKAGSAEGVKTYVDGSFKTSLEDAYENYTNSKVSKLDNAVADYLGVEGATVLEGDTYIISPYIGGGYLNITNGNKQVIIDPNNKTNTGYIFAVKNGDNFTVGIEANGNATFRGKIIATSLELGTNKIPTSNISGLDVYATNENLQNNYVNNTALNTKLSSYATTGELSYYLKTNDLNAKLGDLNVAYNGDVTTTQEQLTNGIIKTTAKYKDSNGVIHTTTTYSAEDSDYVLLSRDNQWGSGETLVKIESDGLLTAKNAVIYGKIYASEGEFAGNLTSSSIGLNSNSTTNKGLISLGNLEEDDGDIYKKVSLINDYASDTENLAIDFGFKNTDYNPNDKDSKYATVGMAITKKNGSIYNQLYVDTYLYGYLHLYDENSDENEKSFIARSTDTYNGLYASNAIHTPRVYAGNYVHGDYALDVNGTSYFSKDAKFNGVVKFVNDYYLNGLQDSTGNQLGIYCSGQFNTQGKVMVGNVEYPNCGLGVNGNIYTSGNFTMSGSVIRSGSTDGLNFINNAGTQCVLYYNSNYDTHSFRPYSGQAENILLGTNAIRWGQIYTSTAVNTNSDRNLKKNIYPLSDNHVKFFMSLQPVSFLFKDGTSGRTHIGFISQDVELAMQECGLTDLDFAGFCKDIKKKYTTDENGNEIEETVYDENGNPEYIYSLRYEEFIALNTHMIQKTIQRVDTLEEENEKLKQEIKEIKEAIANM